MYLCNPAKIVVNGTPVAVYCALLVCLASVLAPSSLKTYPQGYARKSNRPASSSDNRQSSKNNTSTTGLLAPTCSAFPNADGKQCRTLPSSSQPKTISHPCHQRDESTMAARSAILGYDTYLFFVVSFHRAKPLFAETLFHARQITLPAVQNEVVLRHEPRVIVQELGSKLENMVKPG